MAYANTKAAAAELEVYSEACAIYVEWCEARGVNFRGRMLDLMRRDLLDHGHGTLDDSAAIDRFDAIVAGAMGKLDGDRRRSLSAEHKSKLATIQRNAHARAKARTATPTVKEDGDHA